MPIDIGIALCYNYNGKIKPHFLGIRDSNPNRFLVAYLSLFIVKILVNTIVFTAFFPRISLNLLNKNCLAPIMN